MLEFSKRKKQRKSSRVAEPLVTSAVPLHRLAGGTFLLGQVQPGLVTDTKPGLQPPPVPCLLAGAPWCTHCTSLHSLTLNDVRVQGPRRDEELHQHLRWVLLLIELRVSHEEDPSWWPGRGGTDATLGCPECPAPAPHATDFLLWTLLYFPGWGCNMGERAMAQTQHQCASPVSCRAPVCL